GSSGVVNGNITAENIIVSGKITGTLTARGRIILESTARLEGDINTSRLAIAEGASFKGRSNTGEAAKSGSFGDNRESRIKIPPATQESTAGA
ncbi:polymer-forming cytoskeletal protein, partial [bacterium]